MNCEECRDLIDPYIDNELDVSATILLKRHLRECSQCRLLLESRKALQTLLKSPELQFEVPDTLRDKSDPPFQPPQSVCSADPARDRSPPGSSFHLPWRRR